MEPVATTMTGDKNTYLAQPVLILLGSNLVGALVGGVFFLCASLNFALDEIGLYTVIISIQSITSGLVGSSLGIATIRVATDRLVTGEKAAAAGIVALALILGACFSPIITGACLGIAGLISGKTLLPGTLAMLVIFWASVRTMLDSMRFGLLAGQQYSRAAILMGLSALTGIIALAIVNITGDLTLERLLIAHVLGLGASVLLGIGLLLPLGRAGIDTSTRQLRALLAYARWPVLSQGAKLLQAHVGPVVLMSVADAAQTGLYGLGRYPAFLFGVVVASLYQYWLPEAAREQGRAQLRRFLKHHMRLAGFAGCGMIVSALALKPLLSLLGSNFADAAPLFVFNAIDFALILLIGPMIASYHALRKPQLELLLVGSALLLLIGVALALAAQFGATGMVGAQICAHLATLGLASWLIRRQLKEPKRQSRRLSSTALS